MQRAEFDNAGKNGSTSRSQAPWECELLVVRGENRQDLRSRLLDISNFLKLCSDVDLADLAYTLTCEDEHEIGLERIAFVADSSEQLLRQIGQASDRLEDNSCEEIRDGSGIYYVSRPSYPAKRLAYLFPGEGAQYLGMLGDLLPYFPLARDLLKTGDELAAVTGRGPRSVSRYLLPSPNLTSEQRDGLEEELNSWDNTIYTVLIGNWILVQLLADLGLRPDALAGHSIGELSALMNAGCFEFGDQLKHLGGLMQALENRYGCRSAQAAVLAVAASRHVVSEAIEHVNESRSQPPDVFLAIDNCPHQTVAVGWPDAVSLLEIECKSRSLIFERLTIDRPYHCSLFEPFTGPIRDLFRSLPFEKPRTPVYCCSTASRFPSDPDEIRRLCVRNWVSTVEFADMVRQMHADDVGVFLEAGPRGNLTAFVDDVLLGHDYLAVPANLARRSGLQQILHMTGQLTAHHVPMELAKLYRDRALDKIELNGGSKPGVGSDRGGDNASRLMSADAMDGSDDRPAVSGVSGQPATVDTMLRAQARREAVLPAHWQVMDKFLDTQRFVNERLFELKAGRSVAPNGNAQIGICGAGSSPSPGGAVDAFPLIGEIIDCEPGRSLVARRSLDPGRDLYCAHHAFGGHRVSKLTPEQHGFAIMPLTFVIELLAETAAALVPGTVVIGVENLRMFQWLPIEDPPSVIEVSAEVVESHLQPEQTRVRVGLTIRKLLQSDAATGDVSEPASNAEIVLARKYPEAPLMNDIGLEDERPCRVTVEDIYRNTFHGPLFKGVQALARTGTNSIEGQIEVLPRAGLLDAMPDPQFLVDPVTVDIAMHILVGWHLEQDDQSGRIVLPFELDRISIYGPSPLVGQQLTSRGYALSSSHRVFQHAVDIIDQNKRVWCSLSGLKCWRFYLPFGEVNFHGPKDVYWLSNGGPVPRSEVDDRGGWCAWLNIPEDAAQLPMRQVIARVWLTKSEQSTYADWRGGERRLLDWLFGRVAAKDAVRRVWAGETGEALCPADIEIIADENGAPTARRQKSPPGSRFVQVSLAHAEGMVAALAAFEPYVGIDLEPIVSRGQGFEEIALDKAERALLPECGVARDEMLTRMWCAKEAVAKALRLGLVDGPRGLSVDGIDNERIYIVLGSAMATAAPGFEGQRLIVHTRRNSQFIIAHTFCKQDKT